VPPANPCVAGIRVVLDGTGKDLHAQIVEAGIQVVDFGQAILERASDVQVARIAVDRDAALGTAARAAAAVATLWTAAAAAAPAVV
jgi:hypothetical protein